MISISHIATDIAHFFHVLVGHMYIFFWEICIQDVCPILTGFLWLLLFLSFLNILDFFLYNISNKYFVSFCWMLPHSVDYYFSIQKLSNLIWSHMSSFIFLVCVLRVLSKNHFSYPSLEVFPLMVSSCNSIFSDLTFRSWFILSFFNTVKDKGFNLIFDLCIWFLPACSLIFNVCNYCEWNFSSFQ